MSTQNATPKMPARHGLGALPAYCAEDPRSASERFEAVLARLPDEAVQFVFAVAEAVCAAGTELSAGEVSEMAYDALLARSFPMSATEDDPDELVALRAVTREVI